MKGFVSLNKPLVLPLFPAGSSSLDSLVFRDTNTFCFFLSFFLWSWEIPHLSVPQRTQTTQRESPFISSCKILCCSVSSTQNSQPVPQVRAGLLWLMDSLTRCWESSQPCRTCRAGSYTHHCAGGFTVRWPRNPSQFSLLCNLGCLLSSGESGCLEGNFNFSFQLRVFILGLF